MDVGCPEHHSEFCIAVNKIAQDNVNLFSSLMFDNHQFIKIFTTGDTFTQHVPLKDNSYDQNFFIFEEKEFSRRLATPSFRKIL